MKSLSYSDEGGDCDFDLIRKPLSLKQGRKVLARRTEELRADDRFLSRARDIFEGSFATLMHSDNTEHTPKRILFITYGIGRIFQSAACQCPGVCGAAVASALATGGGVPRYACGGHRNGRRVRALALKRPVANH